MNKYLIHFATYSLIKSVHWGKCEWSISSSASFFLFTPHLGLEDIINIIYSSKLWTESNAKGAYIYIHRLGEGSGHALEVWSHPSNQPTSSPQQNRCTITETRGEAQLAPSCCFSIYSSSDALWLHSLHSLTQSLSCCRTHGLRGAGQDTARTTFSTLVFSSEELLVWIILSEDSQGTAARLSCGSEYKKRESECVCVDWAGFVSRPICERAKDKCNARQPCLLGLFHLRLRSYVGLWWRGRCGWMWIKKEKTESSFYLNQLFFPTESDSVTPVLPLFEGMVVDPVGPGATLRLLHHHHTFCSFGVQSKLKGDESCTLSLPAVDGVPAAGQRWGKVITG